MKKILYCFGKNQKNEMITEAHLNFFKNKKILITGNTGFVGSNLSIVLSLLGSKVVGFSKKKKKKG